MGEGRKGLSLNKILLKCGNTLSHDRPLIAEPNEFPRRNPAVTQQVWDAEWVRCDGKWSHPEHCPPPHPSTQLCTYIHTHTRACTWGGAGQEAAGARGRQGLWCGGVHLRRGMKTQGPAENGEKTIKKEMGSEGNTGPKVHLCQRQLPSGWTKEAFSGSTLCGMSLVAGTAQRGT